MSGSDFSEEINNIGIKIQNEVLKTISNYFNESSKNQDKNKINNQDKNDKNDKNQQLINTLINRVNKLENTVCELKNEISNLKGMKKQLDEITGILNDDDIENDNEDDDIDDDNIDDDNIDDEDDILPPLINDDDFILPPLIEDDNNEPKTESSESSESQPSPPDFSKMINQFETFGKSMAIEFIKSFNLTEITKKIQ